MVGQLLQRTSERWDAVPPGVEEQEAAWWDKYAWLEDDYAWVHSPPIRKAIRSHYFKRILKSLPADATVVDFGCGPGWLAILLCQLGARHVIGVDNSPAQIAIARTKAEEAGVADKIDFVDKMDADTLKSADALIVHGVLHHLSGDEIDAFSQMITANVSPTSKIFILEPVVGSRRYMMWSAPFKLLDSLRRLRTQSAEERRIRTLLEGRVDGPRHPGYGVSPKERPFRIGELERRLSKHFAVTTAKPVLFFSVRVAMELLLMAETQPKFANFLIRFGLKPYMLWERLSFVFAPKELWDGWVFCMVEATPRK